MCDCVGLRVQVHACLDTSEWEYKAMHNNDSIKLQASSISEGGGEGDITMLYIIYGMHYSTHIIYMCCT